ncbi:hypothetical protein BYT27DRAFT_7215209 [Phlegmacium glaucopus]|nr:hypothetical protein BYT27DRAFT_7215209 [Phlegmacium glaucopus]
MFFLGKKILLKIQVVRPRQPSTTELQRQFSLACLFLTQGHLKKMYHKHAARLCETGGGVDQNDSQSENHEETLAYYIPGSGPNNSTLAQAVNLWRQIGREFIFFPTLHRIFATQPNVTPIAITMALGPHGQKTIWFQPPNNTQIHGFLLKMQLCNLGPLGKT